MSRTLLEKSSPLINTLNNIAEINKYNVLIGDRSPLPSSQTFFFFWRCESVNICHFYPETCLVAETPSASGPFISCFP